jgi:hypothetical protein
LMTKRQEKLSLNCLPMWHPRQLKTFVHCESSTIPVLCSVRLFTMYLTKDLLCCVLHDPFFS